MEPPPISPSDDNSEDKENGIPKKLKRVKVTTDIDVRLQERQFGDYMGHCYACLHNDKVKDFHRAHIEALETGGNNEEDNIVYTHWRCNTAATKLNLCDYIRIKRLWRDNIRDNGVFVDHTMFWKDLIVRKINPLRCYQEKDITKEMRDEVEKLWFIAYGTEAPNPLVIVA